MSRGRYAPSPTGGLHLGNAVSALVAWLMARSAKSSFVMRVEDLDEARTRPQAVTSNLDELRWLGLDWDEGPDVGGPFAPYRQSQRHDLYRDALDRLREKGLVFECYLSRRELREIASAPHGVAPVYGERQRRRNREIASRKREEGKEPSLRLRVDAGTVSFDDTLAGPQEFALEREVGDIVLLRADGAWAYQLAVVVDDAAMGIEEVVRGADLLPSTAAQLVIYRELNLRPPRFAHLPLLVDEAGERLAKRKGPLTLGQLQSDGVAPERVVGLLGSMLGQLDELRPTSAGELLSGFAPGKLPNGQMRLTREHIAWLGSSAAWS